MIEIKQFDTGRIITDTLTLGGSPVNLAGSTVRLMMRPHTAKTPVKAYPAALTATPNDGKVSVQPTDAMVEKSGLFEVEWEVKLPSNKFIYFPTEGYDLMQIYPNDTTVVA